MPLEASRTMASPGAQLLAQGQPAAWLDQTGAGSGQVDAAGLDDAGERGCLPTAPSHLAGVAGGLPAGHEGLGALGIGKPVAAAGCPVGLHHQRRGAHGDEVVDGHCQGVLGNAREPAATGEPLHLIGHQGLSAQAFDDAGQVEGADIQHIGRFAA
jgi:hypothetical protein